MKKDKEELRGSFTVEAAMIMPIVLIVIFTIMYYSFYLHDLCAARATAGILADEVCRVKEKETPVKECLGEKASISSTIFGIHMSDQMKQQLGVLLNQSLCDKLFVCRVNECELDAGSSFFRAKVALHADVPIPMVHSLIPVLRHEIMEERTIYDPVRTVRFGKMIYDEFEKTKAYESVKHLMERMEKYIS